MFVYDYSAEHDLAITNWWLTIRDNGELKEIFTQSVQSLSAFLGMFAPPRTLVFEADEKRIWLAVWLDPIMSGVFLGLWLASDKRHSPGALRSILTIYELALRQWPVIIGVSRQKDLLRVHERLGYTTLGVIPHLYDGDDAMIFVLTKEGFEHGRRRRER